LKRHSTTHTGEKPFKCPVCPHVTSEKSSLKKHLLFKHPRVASSFFSKWFFLAWNRFFKKLSHLIFSYWVS
jgi:uncharacterized Zn-finger protein